MKWKFLNNKRFNKNKQITHKEIIPKLQNCRTEENYYTRQNVKGKSKAKTG